MSLQITGVIKELLPDQTGTKKDGSGQWIKQCFLVQSDAQYNNLYCFEVFGEEKVNNLNQYNKIGDTVTVEFNVNTNEHNGNYYTTLSAWKITKQIKESGTFEHNEPQPLGQDNEPDSLSF